MMALNLLAETLHHDYEGLGMSQATGVTVEEAAAQIVTVELTHQAAEPGNASFERRFRTQQRNPFLGWNPAPRSICNYEICDAVLDGEFRGLINSNGFIEGTGYLLPKHALTRLKIDESRIVKAPDEDKAIVGCNAAYRNYFHWTTQALPAMDASLRRAAQDRDACLVLPPLNTRQEESLHLLGLSRVKRFVVDNPASQCVFGKIEFSEILNGGAAFCLSELAYKTYSRIRQAVETSPVAGKKIYVARTDTMRRRMRNEDVVIEEMSKRGFEIAIPGTLTFTEQVRLFRGASLVIGTHGAGMTNIVFCEPGTLVYELVPSHYTNACFCNLARICKLRYWADAFESEGPGLSNLREWESDTRVVTERLDEIEAILAEKQ
jgi:hypothetical protein